MAGGNTTRTKREDLRIGGSAEGEWQVRPRTPAVGEVVRTVEGPAEVIRVLGKVSDGSRLLELRIDRDGPVYFAATSNVLQRPEPGPEGAS